MYDMTQWHVVCMYSTAVCAKTQQSRGYDAAAQAVELTSW